MSKDRIFVSSMIVFCGTIAGVAGTALATWPIGTPGWEYGRLHCSQLGDPCIDSKVQCLNCCEDAVGHSYLDPKDLEDCEQYCQSNPWVVPCK
ncbi:MAG: hypothetical protein K2X36_08650 [Microbacteriaceae bacterium]|nr:hypothetical protein [Microbacteriaceae bacterium]